MRRGLLRCLLCGTALLPGCSRRDGAAARSSVAIPASATPPTKGPKKCVLHLHGKGGNGEAPRVVSEVTHLHPSGNGLAWGGRSWLYFPDSRYVEVRAITTQALSDAGCGRVIVHGFSNGASAAAKLFCRGETFNGTASGYIVDDPVPDQGVVPCQPSPGMRVQTYWTGALTSATDGWSCAAADWTCEGGTTLGIARYALALGAREVPSVTTRHEEYASPPEETSFW